MRYTTKPATHVKISLLAQNQGFLGLKEAVFMAFCSRRSKKYLSKLGRNVRCRRTLVGLT